MKRLALLLAPLALLALPSLAHAGASHRRAGTAGVGLGGGTTGAGLSAKVFLSDASAVQAVAGPWGSWGNGGLGLSADHLYEMPTIAEGDAAELAWNWGAGAGVGIFSETATLGVGVSAVAGLEVAFKPVPLDLVVEYRPTLAVLPGVDLDLIGATAHLRYFF
jgi:hypothetical protein